MNDWKAGEWVLMRLMPSLYAFVSLVVVPDQVDFVPEGAASYLETKLMQVTTEVGMSAGHAVTQFALIPRISLVTKDMLPGPPRIVAMNMEITLFITDFWGEKVFASTNIPLKGTGTNETKAYNDGIKRINTHSPAFQSFIRTGKDKIQAYYDANYSSIIKDARSRAGQKNFEEALYLLTSIPYCCKGYDAALKETASIYQSFVNEMCNQNLARARSAWMAQQNSAGADNAGQFLQFIYPDANCYGDAMALYNEIKGKVLDDWKFVMRMYDDQISLEEQRISAYRAIGVAWGTNQRRPVINNYTWIRSNNF
ncbi:hypothetical protein AGMMS49574_28500 [Bacteroidia bacterium]|nr:hypothetical protein AGMMS49574_28500 [Bacteroidia bacterium]